MAWSITPNDATIDNDGVANIPTAHSNSDVVYTVKYTDENGCTGNTTYTVKACACSNITITNSSPSFTSGGSEVEVGSCSLGCKDFVTLNNNSASWVTLKSIGNDGKLILVTAQSTESAQRSGTVYVKMNNTECTTAITATQAGTGSSCSCDNISVNYPTGYTFAATGGSINLAVINSPCVIGTDITVAAPNWLTTGVTDTNTITLTASKNEGDPLSDTVSIKLNSTSCVNVGIQQEQEKFNLVFIPRTYTISKIEVINGSTYENIQKDERAVIPVGDYFTVNIYRKKAWTDDEYTLESETENYFLYPHINGIDTCQITSLQVLYDDYNNMFFGRGADQSHRFMDVGYTSLPCPDNSATDMSLRTEDAVEVLCNIIVDEDAHYINIENKIKCTRSSPLNFNIALTDKFLHCTDYIPISSCYDYEPKDAKIINGTIHFINEDY